MFASSRRYVHVTDSAPWRMAVRMQSMPVSPPPRTTTRLALQAHELFSRARQAQLVIDVRDEVRQRLVHARQIFTREAALHVLVGAHAHEHGVVLGEQLLQRDVLADLDAEAELDTHAFHHFARASRPLPFRA